MRVRQFLSRSVFMGQGIVIWNDTLVRLYLYVVITIFNNKTQSSENIKLGE